MEDNNSKKPSVSRTVVVSGIKKSGSAAKRPTAEKSSAVKRSGQVSQSGAKRSGQDLQSATKRSTSERPVQRRPSYDDGYTEVHEIARRALSDADKAKEEALIKEKKAQLAKKKARMERIKKERAKKQRRIIYLFSLVIGLVFAGIITLYMRHSMLGVNVINTEYIMGNEFNIRSYVEAKNSGAIIQFDESDFKPNGVGEYKVKYKVVCGKLSSKKKVKINVIDNTSPVIYGPTAISFFKGETVDWDAYYDVEDEQQDIKVKPEYEFAANKVGSFQMNLTAKDWAGNETTRNVKIYVGELTGIKEIAARAARAYSCYYTKALETDAIYVMEAETNKNDIDYVVAVTEEIVFAVYKDGHSERCITNAEASEEDDVTLYGDYETTKDLVSDIKGNGEKIEITDIGTFGECY